MNEINDKIQAAIAENLPSAIGDVLRKRLEEAAHADQQLKASREEVASLRARVEELTKRVADEGKLETLRLSIDGREAAVSAREREADLLKLRVELGKERLDDMKGLVRAVFENNRFKYYRTETGQVPAEAGCYTVGTSKSVSIEGEA
jgi:hypothetical protein